MQQDQVLSPRLQALSSAFLILHMLPLFWSVLLFPPKGKSIELLCLRPPKSSKESSEEEE
jgi:hypothetical protein